MKSDSTSSRSSTTQLKKEIQEELGDLHSLNRSLKKLRAQYKKTPLLGPLKLSRLEEVLVAEFKSKRLAKQFENEIKKTADVISSREQERAETSGAGRPASGGSVKSNFQKSSRNKLAALSPLARETKPSEDASGPSSGAGQDIAFSNAEPGRRLAALQPSSTLKKLSALENSGVELSGSSETPLIFDIPVTYNKRVRHWIKYFQTTGRNSFRIWLERSSRYLPVLQYELAKAGLPQDLVYVAMIESGFSPVALSSANALGLWQFIAPTGQRYGLKIDWWIDERRDFEKSTRAAISYMTDLYKQFNSWYLVAASYNMGENGVRRLIKKHGTNNFWELADRGALPNETTNYVPKIIAAILISKAPALYGFRDLNYHMPVSFEYTQVPGGTDLVNLSNYLGVSEKYLKELNPELIKGFVPRNINGHQIRIPKGAVMTVSQYIRLQGNDGQLN